MGATSGENPGLAPIIQSLKRGLGAGTFNASRMIGMLGGAVEDALRDGFAGLCAAGDMTWLLDEAPGSEELAEYEALLNHFYKGSRAGAAASSFQSENRRPR